MYRLSILVVLALAAGPVTAQAPSYSGQVQPFFARYCVECHSSAEPEGGLNLENYKGLLKGGTHGAAVVPGSPDTSRLVRMLEGKLKPAMPPRKARQPSASEIASVRAWVAAGAREGAAVRVALPELRPRASLATPVAAVAYHPDGKLLAAGGRSEVLFLDATTGEVKNRLPGQRDRVTALAFSKDGRRLAVASSRAGEGHDVRLYEASAWQGAPPFSAPVTNKHDDVIHDLAFSPDGTLLASCSYDRLIKFWDVSGTVGREVRALRDHSDAVYGISFSPDGKLLASASADRAIKVWDVLTGARLYTLGESTDWAYAVAWSPAGNQLAAGGVDRSIRVWEATARGGRILHSVFAHEGPVTRLVYSSDGTVLSSLGEDRVVKAWDAKRMVERQVYPTQPEAPLSLAVRPDGKQIAVGRFDGALVLLDALTGKVTGQPLPVRPKPPGDRFKGVSETEPNDSPRTGQKVSLSATLIGAIDKAGDVDWYRFEARAGEEVGAVVRKNASKTPFDPVLTLVDPEGNVVAESENGLLGHACRKAGTYALGVRDREYRGGPGMGYRLDVGAVPVITSAFPLGARGGTVAEVRLEGVHLGKTRTVRLKIPADAVLGSRIPVPFTTPGGPPRGTASLVVGEFPDVAGPGGELSVPGTANGIIEAPAATQTWRFRARKGERLLLEVEARRLGSPLDSAIEILDAKGRPLPRATLRSLAKTYTVFRDHDSRTPGIRIEAWSELTVNDYLLVGSELLKIKALPRNPDDDCQFFSEGGQRLGYLGTTATFQSQGQPMYKVAIHPPGTTFPPNGLPVVTVFWRNDDGGPGFGKDSRLVFDPPADGEYKVRIGDSRGEGSPAHAYRLTVRQPRPDFTVNFSPTAPVVSKGGAVPVRVTVRRVDDFDGPITVRLLGLPTGLHAPSATIPAGENSTAFALYASPTAAAGGALKLEAKAMVNGKVVVREASGGAVRVTGPGDIVITTEQAEVAVRPGGEVRVGVKIERRNGFKGRVPLEVLGLSHGVRVLDVGLNGILITEALTTRTFVIYAEPWVAPTTLPFVVVARREGSGREHAARSVILRIEMGK